MNGIKDILETFLNISNVCKTENAENMQSRREHAKQKFNNNTSYVVVTILLMVMAD